jgi:hypothetical protein
MFIALGLPIKSRAAGQSSTTYAFAGGEHPRARPSLFVPALPAAADHFNLYTHCSCCTQYDVLWRGTIPAADVVLQI